jgi:hypothetical protein
MFHGGGWQLYDRQFAFRDSTELYLSFGFLMNDRFLSLQRLSPTREPEASRSLTANLVTCDTL